MNSPWRAWRISTLVDTMVSNVTVCLMRLSVCTRHALPFLMSSHFESHSMMSEQLMQAAYQGKCSLHSGIVLVWKYLTVDPCLYWLSTHVDMSIFPVLGAVLSHGYLACGIILIRLAFPALACSLLGPTIQIPDNIIRDTFVDYVSCYEGEVLKEAFSSIKGGECGSSFSATLAYKLTSILSRFGCRQNPTPVNINCLVSEVAHHEFMVKPLGAVYAINSGIPTQHKPFWKKISVGQLYSLYKDTPTKVLEMLVEPEEMNSARDRVFGDLT